MEVVSSVASVTTDQDGIAMRFLTSGAAYANTSEHREASAPARTMISHEHGIFEFTLDGNLAMVALVQRSALEFAERLVKHAEWRSKLEVAVNELLENSVKYLAAGNVAFRLQITRPPGQVIRVSTRNKGARDDIARLCEEIDALKRGDPTQYYQHAMVRAVRSAGESRLGLSRVAAESTMRLDYELLGSDEIEVSAHALVPN